MQIVPHARTLVPLRGLLFLALVVIGFPWSTLDLLGIAIVFAWSLFATVMLIRLIASGLYLSATSAATFVLAYSPGLGESVAEGVTMRGLTASSDGIIAGLASLALFLVALLVTSTLVRDVAVHLAPGSSRSQSQPHGHVREHRSAVDVALVLALAITFVAALSTGMWTQYGGGEREAGGGGIRLELLYPSMLLVVLAYGALSRLDPGAPPRLGMVTIVVAVVDVGLLFVLQARRIMVATAILLALVMLVRAVRAAGLAFRLGVVAVILLVFTLGSAGWRQAEHGEHLSLSQRMSQAIDAIGDTKTLESIESRLTYLWFDGTVQDLSANQGAELDGVALLASEVAVAIPRVLFPAKNEVPFVVCETGLEGFPGMDVDLPCTPTGEGYLIGGFFGVLLAGLLWGVTLGAAEIAVERGGVWRVCGLFMLVPFVVIESGVFSIVTAVRSGLIGGGFVLLIALAVRLVLGQRVRRARSGAA